MDIYLERNAQNHRCSWPANATVTTQSPAAEATGEATYDDDEPHGSRPRWWDLTLRHRRHLLTL
jgi:hypothetical protein